MNNSEIIANEAVASGFFTETEIEELTRSGQDIPFHTFAGWKARRMVPKSGSHGWETRLWKKKNQKKPGEEAAPDLDKNEGFYLAKSFLYHISQCEEVKEDR